jgi:hypothetical protein
MPPGAPPFEAGAVVRLLVVEGGTEGKADATVPVDGAEAGAATPRDFTRCTVLPFSMPAHKSTWTTVL